MDVESPPQPLAGVCLHISSLASPYGIGDLGDSAMRFILALESMNMGVWQVLPTGPTGYGDSPYQLQSTFAGNTLFLDLQALVKQGWLDVSQLTELATLPADSVDFGRLIPLKQAALDAAAGRFLTHATGRQRAAYGEFVAGCDSEWLDDYAMYRVLKQRFGEKPWYEWPSQWAKRDAVALQALQADAQDALNRVKVLQFFFHQQWQKLHSYASRHGVKVLGDMPFYIALDSADAWAHPELLKLDADRRPECVAGVPPDYFSEDGQLWGNPIYDWAFHAQDNYAWWGKRLSHALTLADWVRIDHFRGFEAYWSVPAGAATAREGEWQPGPGAALFEAVRARLGELPIVAEDLGVITPAVDALRKQFGLPGMKVLQFELPENPDAAAAIPPDTFCYTGTHDNDTTVGWFNGSPADTRTAEEIAATQACVLQATCGTAATVHLDVLRLALASPAQVAIAPMQDILGLGSRARLNTPGVPSENWRWRLLPAQLSASAREQIRDMVRASGRAAVEFNHAPSIRDGLGNADRTQ